MHLKVCEKAESIISIPKAPIKKFTIRTDEDPKTKKIWKQEFDLEYEYFLSSMRTYKDATYLIEERNDLISKYEAAQVRNVELRKDIRAMERELYIMFQRNIHNSTVIDGLQVMDEQIKQTLVCEVDLKHKIKLAGNEQANCEEIISTLQHEIRLLTNKNKVDEKMIDTLRPHSERLKDILNTIKLKNHQEAKKFKRELQDVSEEAREKDSEQKALLQENAEKTTWLEGEFQSIMDKKAKSMEPSVVEEEETVKEKTGKEAKAKPPAKKTKEVEIGAKFALMKEETPKFIADTELIENENDVVTNLISDYLEKVIERFDDLISLSISLHTIESRISFVQEYIDRLNKVRLKQVPEPEDETLIVEELDQLEIIFETQRKEGDFLKVLLDYFVKRGKDDFLINTVFLNNSKEQLLECLQIKILDSLPEKS
ncbi:uncharacterized protein CDAR_55741 [Caerostris darwini]|uniref:Uncharacterized protein n=1 Tax=Caerostris darwini TaxID=1538125 RepID=A0AAV4W243_9ARAC|nr:uncharacterized protein CDAR_55741 [Caerostris darwini]